MRGHLPAAGKRGWAGARAAGVPYDLLISDKEAKTGEHGFIWTGQPAVCGRASQDRERERGNKTKNLC